MRETYHYYCIPTRVLWRFSKVGCTRSIRQTVSFYPFWQLDRIINVVYIVKSFIWKICTGLPIFIFYVVFLYVLSYIHVSGCNPVIIIIKCCKWAIIKMYSLKPYNILSRKKKIKNSSHTYIKSSKLLYN